MHLEPRARRALPAQRWFSETTYVVMLLRTVSFVSTAVAVAATSATCSQRQSAMDPVVRSVPEFDARLESLRQSTNIPAISVAIVAEQRIAWSKGYGTADLSTGRQAADTTTYHYASLTKPFAAAVLLQLADEGRISLDDPVANYGINLPDANAIRIRHLMSHTSSGTPGTVFRYDGNRFGLLDGVIARVTGGSFAVELQRRLLQPLALTHAAPNPDHADFSVTQLDRPSYQANLARGYTYRDGTHTTTAYPTHFSTAAGMTGSVRDLAAFSMALDRGAVLSTAMRQLAFAPVVTATGDTLPYGLGWFSTRYQGVRIVWHYGYWTANSSLIIKVPSLGLTFVVLANTDALSAGTQLGSGRIETSPWARAFLDTFVIRRVPLP